MAMISVPITGKRAPLKDPRIEDAAKGLAEDHKYLSQWEITPEAWYQMARRVVEAVADERNAKAPSSPRPTANGLAERADDALTAYFNDDPKARERIADRLEALDEALDDYREANPS